MMNIACLVLCISGDEIAREGNSGPALLLSFSGLFAVWACCPVIIQEALTPKSICKGPLHPGWKFHGVVNVSMETCSLTKAWNDYLQDFFCFEYFLIAFLFMEVRISRMYILGLSPFLRNCL